MLWHCRDRSFDLEDRTLVMGVVNVTPDSFSDGGRFLDPRGRGRARAPAAGRGRRPPGPGRREHPPGRRSRCPADEQWRRLVPVLEALARGPAGLPLGGHRRAPRSPSRALGRGRPRRQRRHRAAAIPAWRGVVAARGRGLVLMHMRGTPADMQHDPRYEDVAGRGRAPGSRRGSSAARAAGIAAEAIAARPRHRLRQDRSAQPRADRPPRRAARRSAARSWSASRARASSARCSTCRSISGSRAASPPPRSRCSTAPRIVRTHDVAATVRAVRSPPRCAPRATTAARARARAAIARGFVGRSRSSARFETGARHAGTSMTLPRPHPLAPRPPRHLPGRGAVLPAPDPGQGHALGADVRRAAGHRAGRRSSPASST